MKISAKFSKSLFYLSLILLVFNNTNVFAQPTANFTPSVIEGCAGINIDFTNQSTDCTGNATYAWDFGDGRISDLENPVLNFPNAGTFPISLTVTCDNGSDQITIPITLYELPTADFSADVLTGCVPLAVNFTDNSAPGDGDIQTWRYVFGDGSPFGNNQNASHNYNASGQFTVSLRVVDEYGCENTKVIDQYINVANPPTVDFTASETESCDQTLTTTFTPQVSTSFGLPYTTFWEFGDASNSTDNSPTKTYAEGIYTVTLTVTDDYNCENSRTKTDYIKVSEPIPEYVIRDGATIIEGNTVCQNRSLSFENTTSYSSKWIFGTFETTSNPANYTFTESGQVNITLVLDPGGECETSTSFVVDVEEVNASFTTVPSGNLFSCVVPFEVSFINQSSNNAVSYTYMFGDGASSEEENPTHAYTQSGTYYPALTVTTENNCTHTFIGAPVTINSPDVNIVVDTTEGCNPLPINFEYSGTDAGVITTYNWDFGDGTQINNGGQQESHTFTQPGTYTVTLTVSDNNDCEASAEITIIVGEVYEPDIDVVTYEDHDPLASLWPNYNLCAQDTVELYLAEYDTPGFEDFEFIWYIDSTDNDANNQFMEWQFDKDTGWITINMITNDNGCRDTILWDSVYISGPIIKGINKNYECDNPLDYFFTVNHIIGDRFDWFAYYIDDGVRYDIDEYLYTTDEEWDISFPQGGEYWIQVIAYSDTTNCEFIDSVKVIPSNIEAVLNVSHTEVCVQQAVSFDASASLDATSYKFDFGDGNETEWSDSTFTTYEYSTVGDFVIILYVEDSQGCIDSVTHNISSLGPEIHITATPTSGCAPLTVEFEDNSLPEGDITLIRWELGGGTIGFGDTYTHEYLNPGTYSVSVTVRTVDNCIATVAFPDLINVYDITAQFSTPDSTGCVGDVMSVVPELQNDDLEYFWNFGDGTTSFETSPTHQYTTGGKYDVSLLISDGASCQEELILEDFFTIESVNADFSFASDVIPCWPADPDIIPNSEVSPVGTNVEYKWYMGNGDIIYDEEQPSYLYYAPGEYEISLSITSPIGCNDSIAKTIIIQGPYAEATISTDSVCVGEEITFEMINQQDVESFRWIFDDGSISTDNPANHSYSSAGNYNANLELTAGTCKPLIPIQLVVFYVDADFIITSAEDNTIKYAACSPFEAKFINDSENDIYRYWLVNEQQIGTGDIEELYLFENDGNQDVESLVTLIVEDDFGCRDTAEHVFTTYALPKLNISNDTTICYGDEISIAVTGATTYEWSPNENINSTNLPAPKVSPEENMYYFVTGYNDNNCTARDSVFITVQQYPEIDLSPEMDTIIIGDTVCVSLIPLEDNYTYSWTPQTDITCYDCPEPCMSPSSSQRYTITFEDALGCFRLNYFVDIVVKEEYTIDVPKAFTPEGNESNRVVYVKGFGIKRLIQFRIYNRWGEEVFFTDDINQGWDGYYKGEIQKIDNYVFYVEAEMFDGRIETLKGNILLMR